MFNLIVSGRAGDWERDDLDMEVDRFLEYSGKKAESISPENPESLRQLEMIPSLLTYEIGIVGPNSNVVRHGHLRNVIRYGKMITFEFECDPERPFLPRDAIVEFQAHLDMSNFEQGRTHWAIKDGILPPALLRRSFAKLPPRPPKLIADEYLDAVAKKRRSLAATLKSELESLPKSDAALNALELASLTPRLETPVELHSSAEPVRSGLPKSARVLAVVVGLENYRSDAANQIEPVEFAAADASAFKLTIEKIFSEHSPEVHLLIDEQATYASLRDKIRAVAWSLGEHDLFIFYFAGHGFHDSSGNRLTVWDTSPVNVDGTTLAISTDLLEPLKKSPCDRVLAFIDACASKFKPLGRDILTSLNSDELRDFLSSAAFCAMFLSCRPGERSFSDKELGHGIWTHFLLQALSGKAETALGIDRYLTNASLQDYLRTQVPPYVARHDRIKGIQTPEAIVTATSTFAIHHFPVEGDVKTGEDLSKNRKIAPPEREEKFSGSSTQFFSARFVQAFPGVRGVQWFTSETDIRTRITRLLKPKLCFDGSEPIWWWRDGNNGISTFVDAGDGIFLMDEVELKISRIAAVSGRAYWGSFVYVEVDPIARSGVYDPNPEQDAKFIAEWGYNYEVFGLVDGKVAITGAEFDDGAAMIEGELVDIRGRSEIRKRFLSRYNFFIAAERAPVGHPEFDMTRNTLLNSALREPASAEAMLDIIRRLPRTQEF